ncbi:MAG: CdaR family protein [bacterium]|nr:CdaR family protein [bacterium]
MRLIADLYGRLVQHLPRKLAALAIAFVVWLFVAVDTTTTAQRSLLVPIVVEGVSSEQVVVGLPQVAEITVSGPTSRIDRLRPESFEAVLDLAGLTGDFQRQVTVAPPQGIVLERVVPAEVIGIVETVTIATVPLVATVLGELGPDRRARITVTPARAQVRGRAAIVNQVVAVVAAVPVSDALSANASTVAGYAVGSDGRPLVDVVVEPSVVAVDWRLEPVWIEARVPFEVAAPPQAGWSLPEGAPTDVLLLGPPSLLADLASVAADVDLPTEVGESGRYTRPLRLRLPAGVDAVEAATVTLLYTAPTPPIE